MASQRPAVGLEYVDDVLGRTRGFMNDWMLFSQVISAYPQPNADKGKLEMQFLQLNSKLARELPVIKDRLGPDCNFGPETMNVIAGNTSLNAIFSQSEVAVKKLMTEWHRAFIAINECVGEIEDKRRRAEEGERVMIGGQLIKLRIRKPLPWREIFLYGGAGLLVFSAIFGVYFMRNFLGFWAPGEGEGIAVTDTMTDDQRIRVTMDTMQKALDDKNLDGFMSIFADDYLDSGNRSKTMLRALIQTYVSARGFTDLKLDLSQAKPTFEGESGLFSPVYVTAEGKKYTLYVTGKKSNGRWLITNLSGI